MMPTSNLRIFIAIAAVTISSNSALAGFFDDIEFGYPDPPPRPANPPPPPWLVIRNNDTQKCHVVQQHSGDMGGSAVANYLSSKEQADSALSQMIANGICLGAG